VDEAAAALPSVETVPWVERDQVLEYLDAADLVLLPSRFETFGSAAYEGMLRRRAVLASPTCGFLSWPRLREGAFVTDPGETVSDAVSRLLQLDATVLARVATAGYEGARTLSRDAVDHWVAVLCDAARGRS
jgi:glycosyltransferase involved in cell wall biosynthesis